MNIYMYMYIYIYVYAYTYACCVYIYIYIQITTAFVLERSASGCSPSAQDPSKAPKFPKRIRTIYATGSKTTVL